MQSAPNPVYKKIKIGGLDSIRFFAAVLVALSHGFKPPLLQHMDITRGWGRVFEYFYLCLINGQAAVVLFFLISGFCIHYPQTGRGNPDIRLFYPRRLLRIALPWMAVEFYIHFIAHDANAEKNFLLISWSLQCETAYYMVYPLLFQLSKKMNWMKMAAGTYFFGFIMVAVFIPAQDRFGIAPIPVNIVVCFSFWVMGCLLAEDFVKNKPAEKPRIWLWRAAVGIAAVVSQTFRYYTPVGLPWTLTLFVPLAYFYLRAEIACYQFKKPVWFFELAGAASYSLYLVHFPTLNFIAQHWKNHSTWIVWALALLTTPIVTALFYFLVEYPSHQLARKFRVRQLPSTA